MKLYHYTISENVLSFKEQGLLPRVEPVLGPLDQPVVWLTTQPDVSVSVQDSIVMARVFQLYEAPLEDLHRVRRGEIKGHPAGLCKQWWYGTGERLDMNIGGKMCTVTYVGEESDLVRLTVEIPDLDAKLFRYIKWKKRPKTPTRRALFETRRAYERMTHVRQWYVYLDRIAPNMITEVVPLSGPFDLGPVA